MTPTRIIAKDISNRQMCIKGMWKFKDHYSYKCTARLEGSTLELCKTLLQFESKEDIARLGKLKGRSKKEKWDKWEFTGKVTNEQQNEFCLFVCFWKSVPHTDSKMVSAKSPVHRLHSTLGRGLPPWFVSMVFNSTLCLHTWPAPPPSFPAHIQDVHLIFLLWIQPS